VDELRRQDLRFAVADEFVPFVRDIRDAMATLFVISATEALERINRHWAGLRFVDRDEIDIATHETPEDWARFIYYDSGVLWWLPGENLRVRPYR
jgi:hypothetical protein